MAVMLLQITAKDKLLEAYIRDIEVSCQGIKPPESTLSLKGTKNVTVTPVNDAPEATNLDAAEAFTEDAAAFKLIGIVIKDVDSPNVTATLTLSNSAAGILSTGTSGP